MEDSFIEPPRNVHLSQPVMTVSDFNDEFREDAARSGNAGFEGLTRLHAKACQVASVILTLLALGLR